MAKYLLAFVCFLLTASPARADVAVEDVEYQHKGVELVGHLAYDPGRGAKQPAVLIVHEWWGLNDYAKRRARQLAKMGYVAFALDMYGKGKSTKEIAKAQDWSGHFRGSPLLRQRALAGLEVLRANPHVDARRIAAIGYCFGGTTVMELAYSGAPLTGVVSFHGSLPAPKPADFKNVKAKILVCHGADDAYVSSKNIAEMQSALNAANTDWQMIYYSGAVHSFTNPDADNANVSGVAYNADADRRSWQHMQAFLTEISSE